eukprot:TRINITY_DN103024_c0_g1_i1.p2 TRINITY_DN103024_c0_g1~~TRINITY_DN103024_c0_g1_i1.p2  ORF type:complete len:162 (+),score=33.57 TRINITY_DN103024_c0_g1_i1:668-1153(+)
MTVEFPLTTWGGYEPRVPLVQQLALRALAPVLKFAMREIFKLGGSEAEKLRDQRRQVLLDIMDEADAALAKNGGKYLCGEELSYIDITFASLIYPTLSLLLSPETQWANKKFSSYTQYKAKHPKGSVQAHFKNMADFEEEVLKRPCGKLVLRVFEQRGVKF